MSNAWIQTVSGRKFDLLDYNDDSFCLEDISHALSNCCRFAGHTKTFYSVAQHCVFVSDIIERLSHNYLLSLAGLLHDGHEAYMGDDTSPKKKALYRISGSNDFESRMMFTTIRVMMGNENFNKLPKDWEEVVKNADQIALVAETKNLFNHPPVENWTDRFPSMELETIEPVTSIVAKQQFVDRYNFLLRNI